MSWPNASSRDYYEKRLQTLVGRQVVNVALDDSDPDDLFWGLKFDDGKTIIFMSDEEGNRGGAFEIQEGDDCQVRGGSHDIENLQWVTAQANMAKRDLTQDEFTSLCQSVIRWLGQQIERHHD